MIQKKKFCLKNILKGGLPCPNAKITWIVPHSDCLTTPCDSCTDECIEITLLGDCDINCVHVRIECPDCDSCPPETHKICFCNTDGDCEVCETCSDAGVCVEKCEHCDPITGECGECSDNTDCPGDLECIQGKCQCPPGTTQDGTICRECSEDGECGPCKVCTENGKCVPKDCGSGVCDPETGECVGCINSGQCGPNEVCVDGECECAPGYVYDPIEGCIPAPPCETDGDCGPCKKCTEDGCVPRECPDGYVCYNDDCVKLCNCDEPDCDKANHGCQRISSDLCACLPCEDGGDCDEIPCEDGTDCPDGYGCKGGVCVPCDSLDCSTGECDDVLGCECLGTRCVDADNKCNGTCSGPEDCGEGCGCYHGKCISCDNFDCEDCASVPGCACNENTGRCEDDGLDCSDTFEINKRDDNCAIEGILVTDKGCQCDRLSMGVKVQSVSPSNQFIRGINFLVELRKGDADEEGILNIPLLSQTGIANELPLSGNLQVRVVEKKRSSSYTTPVAEDVVFSQIFSLAGIDTLETGMLNFNPPGFTKQDPVTGETVTVGEVEVEFILKRKTLNFENSCSYSEEDSVVRYRITADGGNGFIKYSQISGGTSTFRKHEVLESASNRNPIFSWYKSTTQGNETKFRSAYATEESPGYFRDGWISVAEGVEIGKFYRLESDCACDESVFYTCPNSGAISKLRYCNPNDLTQRLVYTLSDCNKTINFNAASNTFNVCQSNSIGGQVYELHLNGQKVKEFTAANGQIVFSGSHIISTSITEIAIKLKDHVCDDCYEPVELTPAELTVESVEYDCDSDALSFSISGGSGNYSLTIDGEPTLINTQISLDTGEHTLIFTDNNTGCTVEQSVQVNCCGDFQVVAKNTTYCSGSDIDISFEILNGSAPFSYSISNESGVVKEALTNDTDVETTIPAQPAGVHTVKVTDDKGCETTATFSVSSSNTPVISIDNVEYCSGVTEKQFSAMLSGGTSFNYEIKQGSTVVRSGVTSGQISETLSITGNTTYTLVVENQSGCISETEFNLVAISCPNPVIEMNTSDICQGKSLSITGLVTGGTPPYQWSVSHSGTTIGSNTGSNILVETGTSYTASDGTQQFTIDVSDSNNVTTSQNINIEVLPLTDDICVAENCPEPPIVTIGFSIGNPVIEEGQSAQLIAQGGQPGFTYTWYEGGSQVGEGLTYTPDVSQVGVKYYTLRYEYSAGCYEFTDEQSVTVTNEPCDCTPTIKVISGVVGLNGKNVTTFTQDDGEDVCVGSGNTIQLQAVFSSGCSGNQVHTWRVRRRIGFLVVQEYIQSGGSTLTYNATNTGDLTVDLTSEDGTLCAKSAVPFLADLVSCESPEQFYANLNGSANICKADAGSYSSNVNVSAAKIHNYLNCNVSCYDTFPFTYKVKRGSTVLASGVKSGGWSNTGNNTFPVSLNLSSYNGITTLTVEVTRTDTNVTVTGTDNVNIRSATDPYCDVCATRTVTANITQGSQVEIYKGESVTLNGTGSSSAGVVTYEWRRVSDNALISSASSHSVSPTTTTDYRLIVKDVDGCEASDVIKIVVNEPCPPIVATLFNPGPQCPEDTVQIFYSVPSGLTGQLSIDSQTAVNVTGSGSESFTMGQNPVTATLSVTDTCGQTETINRTIQVDTGCDCTLTGFAITGENYLCPGESDTYTISLAGGSASGYTFTWYDAPTGGSVLGTGNSLVYAQPTSGLTAGANTSASQQLHSEIRVEATKAGCPTLIVKRKIYSNCGGAINTWNISNDGTNSYVNWCINLGPQCGAGTSVIASVDLFEITVVHSGGTDVIDVTNQSTLTAACFAGSSGTAGITSEFFNVPTFVPNQGFSSVTAEVTITTDNGFVCNRTFTVYPT